MARGRQQMISQIDVSLVHPELRKRITASITPAQLQKTKKKTKILVRRGGPYRIVTIVKPLYRKAFFSCFLLGFQ
jgi:uncharacterized protein YjhX (UPF0386 family)